MTIANMKDKFLKRTKYKCDICGKVDFWSNGWSGYGSENHYDECPGDTPNACSDKCFDELMLKIKSKKFILPVLSIDGYVCHVEKKRIGY